MLFARRQNTGYVDGKWDFAGSGHVDENETAAQAVVREAKEETGISIDVVNVKFAHENRMLLNRILLSNEQTSLLQTRESMLKSEYIEVLSKGRKGYWPNQSPMFTHPFYYIEYDIAQISFFELYGRSKRDYRTAWKDYSGLCHTGGSKNYLDLLKDGNLTNPFTEGAADKICRPVLDELFRLRK